MTDCPDEAIPKPGEGFEFVGFVKPTKIIPAELEEPVWIRNASVFDRDISASSPVTALKDILSDNMVEKLKDNGIEMFFPVQAKIIPYLIQTSKLSSSIRPRDVCVASPTGSGKTLAYVLPIIELFSRKLESRLRVLVIVPIGELAIQIKKVFDVYTKKTPLRVHASTGKLALQADLDQLSKTQFDILIATPGRLVDLINKTDCLDLKHLEILVMDEADRLNADGSDRVWIHDLERAVYGDPINNSNRGCLCLLPAFGDDRVSLAFGCGCSVSSYSHNTKAVSKWLFSATLSKDPVLLQNMNLFHPILFSAVSASQEKANVSVPMNGLTQKMIMTDEETKPLILWHLLQNLGYRRVLCFTGRVENAHRLYLLMKKVSGVKVAEFSSSMTPKEKKESLAKFSWGSIDVLIASDIMARGLDIEDIQYVINYDIPHNDTAYIHRVGRTARAGKPGTAVTIVLMNEVKKFQTIVKKAYKWQGKPFEQLVQTIKIFPEDLDPLIPAYQDALNHLGKQVKTEKKKQRFKRNLVRKRL